MLLPKTYSLRFVVLFLNFACICLLHSSSEFFLWVQLLRCSSSTDSSFVFTRSFFFQMSRCLPVEFPSEIRPLSLTWPSSTYVFSGIYIHLLYVRSGEVSTRLTGGFPVFAQSFSQLAASTRMHQCHSVSTTRQSRKSWRGRSQAM